MGKKWGVCYLIVVDHRLNETYDLCFYIYVHLILVVGEGYDSIGQVKWLKLQSERCFFV